MDLDKWDYVGQLNSGAGTSRLFTLYTTDPIATVMANGYFSEPKRQLSIGDQILVFYQSNGVSYVKHLGVTSENGGVFGTSQILDESLTTISNQITAVGDRVTLLEQNTGAPTQTLPGVVGFAATGGTLNEGYSTSTIINRTGGTTGAMSFDVAIAETNAGTNVVTFNGATITNGATVTIANGDSQATIAVTNTANTVSVAGTIVLTLSNADIGSIDATYNAITINVVPTPAEGSTGVIIEDGFTSLAATQTAWASTSTVGAVVTSFGSATLDVVAGQCVMTLPASGTNNVRLEKNFGNYVGASGVTELWGRCTFTLSGGATAVGRYVKLLQVNWEVAGGDREHQVQLMPYRNSQGNLEYLVEVVHFGTNGSALAADGARITPYWTGISPTFDQEEYLRFHIKNSTSPGAADGIVEFWLNDTLMVSIPPVALNDAGDASAAQFPNRIIISGYQAGDSGATLTKKVDQVRIQTTPVESSWAPAAPSGGATALFAADPDTASPYGWEALAANGAANTSVVSDATLGANVLQIKLPAYTGSFNLYPGLITQQNYSSWVAGLVASDEMFLRFLVRFGSTGGRFFRRDVSGLAGTGLKLASFGISSGVGDNGQSRLVLMARNTADPGVADNTGRIFLTPYGTTVAGTNMTVSESVTAGTWYWVGIHIVKTGAGGTQSTCKTYFAPYSNGSTDYVQDGTGLADTEAALYWEPADYVTRGRVDLPYNEHCALDVNNVPVDQYMFIRYADLFNQFTGPSAA